MIRITDSQKVGAVIAPRTKPTPAAPLGNPATLDGVPVWAVSDPEVISAAVAADGLSATFTATGKLGVSQVSVSADVDLGEGVETITQIDDIEVVAGKAVTLGITFGVPEEAGTPEPTPEP